MSIFKSDDWDEWFTKLKWQLISFKYVSFFTSLFLLIVGWLAVNNAHNTTVDTVKVLFKEGYIDQAAVASIITHSQTVLYDNVLNHLFVAASVILSAIIAIKGVTEYIAIKQNTEVVKKLDDSAVKDNLKRFLSNRE